MLALIRVDVPAHVTWKADCSTIRAALFASRKSFGVFESIPSLQNLIKYQQFFASSLRSPRSSTTIRTPHYGNLRSHLLILNNGSLQSSCQDASPRRLRSVGCCSNGTLRSKTFHEESTADESKHHRAGHGKPSCLSLCDASLNTDTNSRAPNR